MFHPSYFPIFFHSIRDDGGNKHLQDAVPTHHITLSSRNVLTSYTCDSCDVILSTALAVILCEK
jgi:hypothetical protein